MENNFQYLSAAVTDRGLSEKRPQNEDSYLELNHGGLFAVADGVGGAQAGDVASSMAMEILAEAFLNLQQGGSGDAEEIMKIGIEKANSAIFQMSNDLPQLSSMATTVVALHLAGNIATIGHVGDSRLYRLDSGGNLYRETQDHSIVEEEVRAGRMTAEQAVNHPSRNVISRALGAEPTVEVDMKMIMVEPNNTFLLCSDGITRHVDDFEIRQLLASNQTPGDICQQMKALCYKRGAEDNLTAVVVRISSEVTGGFAENNGAAADAAFEEATVATARPPLVSTAILSHPTSEFGEIPTQDLQMTGEMQTHSQAASPTPADPAAREVSGVAAAAAAPVAENRNTPGSAPPAAPPAVDYRTDTYREVRKEEKSPDLLSKLLSAALLFLGGAIFGAVVYYLFAAPSPPAQQEIIPQITQMESKNIPLTSFEENRRNVDRNPQQFIAINAAAPQDAEDYYLLGRAYLLNKQFWNARDALTQAKNKLGQANEENSKTLAYEITLALTIINNATAQQTFEKEIDAFKSETTAPANGSVNQSN